MYIKKLVHKRNRCYEVGSKEHYVDIFSSSLASATFIEKTAKSEQRNYLLLAGHWDILYLVTLDLTIYILSKFTCKNKVWIRVESKNKDQGDWLYVVCIFYNCLTEDLKVLSGRNVKRNWHI